MGIKITFALDANLRRVKMKKNEQNKTITITVSEDFSDITGGRFKGDTLWSAQEFRDELLIPTLNENPEYAVVVDLGDQEGYLPSFLEEVFGGLIRKTNAAMSNRILILASKFNQSVKLEAERYMEDMDNIVDLP